VIANATNKPVEPSPQEPADPQSSNQTAHSNDALLVVICGSGAVFTVVVLVIMILKVRRPAYEPQVTFNTEMQSEPTFDLP
jgi:hypothetical protein